MLDLGRSRNERALWDESDFSVCPGRPVMSPFHVALPLHSFFVVIGLCHVFCAQHCARHYYHFCCQAKQSLHPSASQWQSPGDGSCDGDTGSVTKPTENHPQHGEWWEKGNIRRCDFQRESRCLNVVRSSGEMTLDLNPLAGTTTEDDNRAERSQGTKLEARKNMMCWLSFVPKTLMSSQSFELLFLVLRIEPRALCMLG